MKRLFDTAELELEVFSDEKNLQGVTEEADFFSEIQDSQELGEVLSEIDSIDDFPALELELTLLDGRTLEYEAVGVFVLGEKEYIALHPKTDTEGIIHIMELIQGEDDEMKLLPVEDDEEFEMATEAFSRLIADVEIEGEG